MSKYRDRREKIQQQQSKSLDDLQFYRDGTLSATAEAFVEAAARQRLLQRDQQRLQDSSSPRWKEHYALISSKWGSMATTSTTSGQRPANLPSDLWDDIKKQREEGGYPWTHLSHDQDAEVWIDPAALPPDISRTTMRRKDPSIPREWFHLPAGAEPPSVDQLLRDSSPETDYPTRAKSPPIWGRNRSKSRERKPCKSQRDKDDGGYEPVGLGRDSHQGSINAKEIPPRKAITALPSPPVINRNNKPKLVIPNNKDDNAGGGYEPVGRAMLSPDQLPYASVRPGVKEEKRDKKEAEKSKKELEKAKKEAEKERKQQEKIEREKLEKERKQLERAEAKRKAEEKKAEAEELKRQKEAKKQAEKAEAEARKQAEKAEAEAKKQAEKAEAEAKKQAKLMAEKESKLKAEEAARVKAEIEAKKKAEKEAKLKSEQEAKLEKEARLKAEKEAKTKQADLEAKAKAEKEEAKLKEKQEAKSKAEQDAKWKAEQQEFLQLKQADLERKLNAEKEAAKMIVIEEKPELLTEKVTEAIQVQKLAEFQKSQLQEYDESSKEIKPTFVQLSSRDEITDQDAVESFHHEVENLEWERQLLQEMEQENNDDFEQYFSHPVSNGSSSHKEPTKEAFDEATFQPEKENPLTEKERKKEEKRLKAEKEKYEKERKKQEKLRQKEEEKELKKQKEAKKQAEKEAKKVAEKAKKEAAKAKKEAEREKKNSKETNVGKLKNGVIDEEDKTIEAEENATRETFENTQECEKMTIHENDPSDWHQFTEEIKAVSNNPENRSRQSKTSDLKMPKLPAVDVKARLNSMNESMKHLRMPSPQEVKDGYVNSGFHKQFSQPLSVRTRVEEVDVQQQREQMIKRKTPSELSQMAHPFDIPLPKFKLPKPQESKDEELSGDDPDKSRLYNTLPKSWRQQNIVTSSRRLEDQEEAAARQQLVKSKSPAQLAEMNAIGDFPLPSKVKNFLSPSERKIQAQKQSRKNSVSSSSVSKWKIGSILNLKSKSREEEHLPSTALHKSQSSPNLKDSRDDQQQTAVKWSDTIKKSINSQCLVRSKFEDPNVQAERAALLKKKTVSELSQIRSFNEIPIASTLQQMMKEKAKNEEKQVEIKQKITVQDYIPEGLKSQLLVATKSGQDQEVLRERQDLVRCKTPSELGQVRSISDLPIPTLHRKSSRPTSPTPQPVETSHPEATEKSVYQTLSRSMKTELLVRSRKEDPEVQQERAQAVKAKSVSELSQIKSFDDIPVPSTLENWVGRGSRPVERRKRFREKQKSLSTKSLTKLVPESLHSQKLLVVSKFEDADTLQLRQQIVQSRSVSELSQISGLSDFPVPEKLEKLMTLRRKRQQKVEESKSGDTLDNSAKPEVKDYSHLSPMALHDTLYSTLPRSMKSELRVKSRITSIKDSSDAAIDKVQTRRDLVSSKSVNELSQVKTLADVPIPSPIQNLMDKRKQRIMDDGDDLDTSSQCTGLTGRSSRLAAVATNYDIYASLPSSFRRELLVRSNIANTDYDTLVKRKAIVESKSPAELSQISTLSEIPLPRKIEEWLQTGGPRPQSEMTRMKELASRQVLPDALTKTCLVRCKTEEPAVLQERQQMIVNKNPHELSKIRNINELPMPIKRLQLPDIPLPSAKYMFRSPNRVRRIDEACQTVESSFEGFTPVSTPRLLEGTFSEEEALRFEMSSPESSLLPRDPDFGYEIIEEEREKKANNTIVAESQESFKDGVDADEEDSSVSVADHYRGTPPLKKTKKKRTNSSSQQRSSSKEQTYVDEEMPPPLPPKKVLGQRESSVETTTSFQSLTELPGATDSIQSRPLPTPPTPKRTKKAKSVSEPDLEPDETLLVSEKFHSFRSSMTLVDSVKEDNQIDDTLADSLIESMHTALDTLQSDEATLHSCDNTLNNEDCSDVDDDEMMAEMLPHDTNHQPSVEKDTQ